MKRRKRHKVARILGPDFLPRAEDPALAQSVAEELGPLIDALRGDVAEFDTLTDRARLSRTLIQRGELELLCGRATQAPLDFEEAAALLRIDGRNAPLMLVDARQAWAKILLGDPESAMASLKELLSAEDDVTIRGWEDQLLLWLAAAQIALGDDTAARESLSRAKDIYREQPRRDSSLVDEAWRRLKTQK